jgi:hypothetical protein
VGDFGEVAVVALMERKEAEEVGSRAVVGDGAFLDPGNSRSVVAEGSKSALTAVRNLCENVLVAEDAGELQVGIGKGAAGMGKAHEVVLDVARKALATPRWCDPTTRTP